MEIAIVNKSQLNNCWYPLQYTDKCHLCDKVETCKIQSENRLRGFKTFYENKKVILKKEYEAKIKEINKQLTITHVRP